MALKVESPHAFDLHVSTVHYDGFKETLNRRQETSNWRQHLDSLTAPVDCMWGMYLDSIHTFSSSCLGIRNTNFYTEINAEFIFLMRSTNKKKTAGILNNLLLLKLQPTIDERQLKGVLHLLWEICLSSFSVSIRFSHIDYFSQSRGFGVSFSRLVSFQ